MRSRVARARGAGQGCRSELAHSARVVDAVLFPPNPVDVASPNRFLADGDRIATCGARARLPRREHGGGVMASLRSEWVLNSSRPTGCFVLGHVTKNPAGKVAILLGRPLARIFEEKDPMKTQANLCPLGWLQIR